MENVEKSTSDGDKNQINLPLPDPELQKSQTDLPKPEKEIPATVHKEKHRFTIFKVLVFGTILAITIAAFALIAYLIMEQNKTQAINSYEECVAAGNPVMESYPEQCATNGQTFTRELTTDEIEKLNPGIYEGDEFSFEYPTETFALAHLVCKNHSPSPQLIEKNSNNKYSNVGCVHGIKLDIDKVEKINELLDDPSCYSINKKQITIDNNPATSYTTEFMGGDVDKCTEGQMGKYSLKERYIYVENGDQLYLIWWPIDETIDQRAYDQIISTFKFTDTETFVDTSDWKTYKDSKDYYSFKYPKEFYLNSIESEVSHNTIVISPNNTYGNPAPDSNEINISVAENPKNLTIEEYVKENVYGEVVNFTSINIDGVMGKRTSELPSQLPNDNIKVSYKNKIYSISLILPPGNGISSSQFNQILSTFQFTQ